MKKNAVRAFIAVVISLLMTHGPSAAAQQQQQTPFGVRQIPEPQPAPAAPQPPAPVPPEAQPAPQQPAAVPQDDPVVPFSLAFDNADIYQVIRLIGDFLQLNYIIDPSVRGTVNLYTSGMLRRSDLMPILETMLKINNATMVRIGNFYQIVPANTAIRQPLEVQDRASQAVAPDDQIVLQIIRMKFVAASEMARLLTPYLSEGANIVSHDSGNIILLSERRSNLRKLLELVDVFDTRVFEGDRVRLFPVKNNLVGSLINDLKNVFSGYGLSESGGAIRFVPLDRLNSVLVITGNPSIFEEVEKWIDRLDQPLATAGLRNYVYRLKHTKVSDIQGVLTNLYASPQRQQSQAAPAQGQQQIAPPQPAPAAPFPALQTPGVTSVAVVQGNVRIIPDEVSNSLIVQSTPQEWAEIERTLVQLDLLPRQVLIDAQIYEVSLDDSISIGLSAILQNRGTLTNPQLTNPQTTASFAGTPRTVSGQTFAFIGRTRELVAFLNASENRSRVRTLSAPSVLVKDNTVADFQVGAEVPVPTSSSITPVQQDGTNLFAQTISFRSVGVIMRVRPQINEGGTLTLEISQEVSQAAANTTSAVVAPVIGKTSVTSTVVVQDSQTIAIGGFIRESQERAQNRLPLLGRIPIAGALFGNTSRSNTRTELIVLITPHVIQTREEADLSVDELKSKLREVQKILR
jgi:general secretion pathway protein D